MSSRSRLRRLSFGTTEGSEIVEFAVCLPFLVVLVVGIYDFGSAFTVKHKLNDAVREGNRVVSWQLHPPDPDAAAPGCGVPASVCLARDIIASNLQASLGSDCGLGNATGAHTTSLIWAFTVSSGNCSGLVLTVDRGFVNPTTGALPDPFDDHHPYRVENTRVTLAYPYRWQFAQTFRFLGGDASYLGSTITVSSTMQNLD